MTTLNDIFTNKVNFFDHKVIIVKGGVTYELVALHGKDGSTKHYYNACPNCILVTVKNQLNMQSKEMFNKDTVVHLR